MKADEVRLYALRGGLKKQSVCYTHFHSNKVFRGDLYIITAEGSRHSAANAQYIAISAAPHGISESAG